MEKEQFEKVISSPIRWAGSKKKLLNEMLEFSFVRKKNNYIEPFLGSGIVLINVLKNNRLLRYQNFYVNDINSNIINFFLMIRDNIDLLIKNIKKMERDYNGYSFDDKEKMFYKLRDRYNDNDINTNEKTIIFYFLMKTGFNGVYRENRKGKFNVPFGKKEIINVNYDNLKEISDLIQDVEFYNLDYKEFLELMKKKKTLKDSFIYCDPPYLPEDNCVTKRIDIYTKESFDHEIFFNYIKKINSPVMISLARTKKSDEVFFKDGFHSELISNIVRTINPNKIFTSAEIAYVNYDFENKKQQS